MMSRMPGGDLARTFMSAARSCRFLLGPRPLAAALPVRGLYRVRCGRPRLTGPGLDPMPLS
jgi:hypothetical protein